MTKKNKDMIMKAAERCFKSFCDYMKTVFENIDDKRLSYAYALTMIDSMTSAMTDGIGEKEEE